MRSGTLAALLAALALTVVDARADAPAAPLVRHLASALAEHPLAREDGRIPLLVRLGPGEDGSALGVRRVAPGVGAVRLWPEEVDLFEALHGVRLEAGPPKRPQLDRSAYWNGAEVFRAERTETGDGVVVGVIDTGIDVQHPTFRLADGRSRIRWLLTWGDPQGMHPEIEEAAGCTDPMQASCAVYSNEDIDAVPAIPFDMQDAEGHGTHVASIAAGNGQNWDGEITKWMGMAPEATLIVASPSANGGFGDDEVLRAAQFIFDRADELGLPAVVNISIGGDFGAHDGTSLMEKGLAAMVGDDKPGRAIVVASGNSGGLYQIDDVGPIGVHTEAAVAPHAPASIPVITPGAGAGRVFVWVRYGLGDSISVGLEGPDGTWVSPVEQGADAGYDDEEGTTAAVINDIADDRSTLPEDANSAVVVWSGEWEEGGAFRIVLEGQGTASLWVAAQDEANVYGTFFTGGISQGTVNVPATHPRLLAVGATLNRASWQPLEGRLLALDGFGPDEDALVDTVCFFSGSGPTPLGVPKPEIVAPGAFVAAAMAETADPRTHPGSMFDGPACAEGEPCYLVAEEYALATGTSMSAPQVTGAIALLLQHQPTLTQAEITDALQASARRPEGNVHVPSAMGAGALDLVELLDAAGAELPDRGPVDRAASWWTLSAETARPDLDMPVWGTIELRREGGRIATGLDGSLLGLEVEGGRVVQSITKVRHGLFRFAVAAPAGSGGSALRVRVTYDGAPIGEARSLPIGVDAFAATEPWTTHGGCAAAPARPRARAWIGAFALLAASGVARRRARSSRPA